MEDLLPDFVAETLESLITLDTELVTLEQRPDDKKTLGSIFRAVHTIKGTCGFLGLSRLEKVTHAAENVLGQHREGTLPVTAASITTILRAVDRFRSIVETIRQTGAEPAGDDEALIADLAEVAAGRAIAVAVAPVSPAASTPLAPPAVAPVVAAIAPVAAKPADVVAVPEPAAQTIRVSVEVLEELMTLVSELVLTRNQILQLARSQDNETFVGPLQRLSHITSDLQEGVMKTRMQPIGNAWNNLPRLVRDLAHELDKKIELVMLGADTELDRQVLELIKDPLTHMVRNSGDHGLEDPAGRRAAGKAEQGRITLNAYHEGGHIIVEVGDDGRGLPVERIRAKIIANGLASEADLAGMTGQQIQSFIFRPGFSTAAAVTSVSGRGVGMDVVKTNVERIGGTIDLTSEEGHGTLFTMKIPLTLAIVSALIVDVCGERFAIPQISVVELVRAQTSLASAAQLDGKTAEPVIERINDTPVLRLRDDLLPLINLSDLLKLNDAATPDAAPGTAPAAATDSLYIVVVQAGASRFGLIVDRVFDTEEIVVKPVAPILRHITVFSGNTILGDGSVIMILDPNNIARTNGIGAGRPGAGSGEAILADTESSDQKKALLLFRVGDGSCKAVPLSLISRLENIERSAIENPTSHPVTQYRDKLIPLIRMGNPSAAAAQSDHQPVLVFADGSRVMGLMVDEIVDVVEDYMRVELSTEQDGYLGTAIVNGAATDILDTSFWLKRAFKDWFGADPETRTESRHVLVVEDSAFFRNLILPALSSEGYRVTGVENALAALAMRDAGRAFDLILSDIEMPEMDGFAFVRAIRARGAWSELPVLALSSHTSARVETQCNEAGFDGFISKFDKAILLAAVRAALGGERITHSRKPAMAGQESLR